MKDLKINEIKDLKNEGKSFYWASFFLPKENKKMLEYFTQFADT